MAGNDIEARIAALERCSEADAKAIASLKDTVAAINAALDDLERDLGGIIEADYRAECNEIRREIETLAQRLEGGR